MNRTAFGFTLLELLLVMALLGLLTALAMPRLMSTYHSLEAAYSRDEALSQLSGLGYQAFLARQGFELSAYPASPALPVPLELPAGWTIRAEPPIRFQANGACNGGQVELAYQERRFQVRLDPPFCKARLL